MAKDVPKKQALVHLTGCTVSGKKVNRWLDGVPSRRDTKDMTWINIAYLRTIVLPKPKSGITSDRK